MPWPTRLRPTRIRSRSHPVRLGPTRITGRTLGSGRLGSQRPVTSHDADYRGPTGPGIYPTRVSVHAKQDRCQNLCPRLRTEQVKTVRGCYYVKRQRWSTSQALVARTGCAALQGVSRIQRHPVCQRPLLGIPCHPVGGPAAHRHRTAPCTYTCGCACPVYILPEPRPKAQVPRTSRGAFGGNTFNT